MLPDEDEAARFLRAWMQVRQMVQAANFNRFQREGLSATQFMTLNLVPREGMTLSELARRLNLSAATVSVTVNSLEGRGLLRRDKSGEDGRKVMISATEEGVEMQNSASREFHGFIAGLFGRMSRSRREGLLVGLEAMVELDQQAPARGSGAGGRGEQVGEVRGGAVRAVSPGRDGDGQGGDGAPRVGRNLPGSRRR